MERNLTWADAIAALNEKDAWETIAFDEAVRLHPEHWDGWPYGHPYRRAAQHLANLLKESGGDASNPS